MRAMLLQGVAEIGLPADWYRHHLESSVHCACSEEEPSPTCDEGSALWRLRRAHEKQGGMA
jgi:hypothetical protein